MTDNLCQRYTALTPFAVRKERAAEVFLLIQRLNDKTARESAGETSGGAASGTIRRDARGNIHIRRRATDDMIF